MSEMMTFPDTWEEFEKSYGFTDNEEVYTNGARLIPSFRVKQWLDHLPPVQPKERCIAKITLSEEDLERIVKEQAEEIKELVPQKGEWIWYDDIYDLEKEYICSECRCYALKKDGNQIRSNFCPNCRCDMREGD